MEDENLPNYRLLQLGAPDRAGIQRNEQFSDLDGLVTHHPGANRNAEIVDGVPIRVENAARRSYGVVGGEIQEIEATRTDEYHVLRQDQVLLVKDFILEDSRIASGQQGVRDVDVPAPPAGYIGRVDAVNGVVDILDRQGGDVIARARHLNPIAVEVGDTIGYGQSLGTQNRQGLPATAGKHVHFEIDTRYYQQYGNYVDDLDSGRLAMDPGRQTAGIDARPVIDDGVIRIGESADIVRRVQQQLNDEGFRGADNRPLQVDGVYRLSMQAAVINFQQAHGLPQTGDIDAGTLQQILPRVIPPAHFRGQPDDIPGPGAPPFMNRNRAGNDNEPQPRTIDDPLLSQAERAVRQLDRGPGREYDDQGACMAASTACLAKASGLSRIDHIFLSEARGSTQKGENLFVVQGAPGDPAHLRAQMKTQDAIDMPVEKSLGQLQALNEIPQPQQSLQMDEAMRQTGPQMRMS
jgi:peptidoglycan hydrolase-like protein with peptidoglycan-binding domain